MLCQYNNIYIYNTCGRQKKKNVTTVATVPLGIVATVQNLKKKKNYILNKPKVL